VLLQLLLLCWLGCYLLRVLHWDGSRVDRRYQNGELSFLETCGCAYAWLSRSMYEQQWVGPRRVLEGAAPAGCKLPASYATT
jgi:hypothetical protein